MHANIINSNIAYAKVNTVNLTKLTNATSELTKNLEVSLFYVYLLNYVIKIAQCDHTMDLEGRSKQI